MIKKIFLLLVLFYCIGQPSFIHAKNLNIESICNQVNDEELNSQDIVEQERNCINETELENAIENHNLEQKNGRQKDSVICRKTNNSQSNGMKLHDGCRDGERDSEELKSNDIESADNMNVNTNKSHNKGDSLNENNQTENVHDRNSVVAKPPTSTNKTVEAKDNSQQSHRSKETLSRPNEKKGVNKTNEPIVYTKIESGKKSYVEDNIATLTSPHTERVWIKGVGTSKLGKIISKNSKVYGNPNEQKTYILAGSTYMNQVLYIKMKLNLNGKTYFLISNRPSSTSGVIGWIASKDITTYTHTGVDNKTKSLYLKGTGVAYNKPWGGSKNIVYNSAELSKMKGNGFQVHLTQKVGANTWYRGTLKGKTIWLHGSHVTATAGSAISKLGKIKSKNNKIYKSLGDTTTAITAGNNYTNEVYYIKRQTKLNGKTYFLISNRPSSTSGVIGWIASKDITTYTHTGVDNKAKSLYLKGTGVAYTKPWGGGKNIVYNSAELLKMKGNGFQVHLTQKVGANTWYRGTLKGKTIWLHGSHVTTTTGSATSKLGKIKSKNNKIYKSLGDTTTAITAGNNYTNEVYYIKRQTKLNGKTYFLISNRPSSTSGVIGWIASKGITTYTHTGVDNKAKSLYLKGTGVAYNKPWGGSKNIVYNSAELSKMKGNEFRVHLTQKVGANIWYRGTLKGKTIWIHKNHLKTIPQKNIKKQYTNYNITLVGALKLQMKTTPQTDAYMQYVSSDWIGFNGKNYYVTADVLNVRSGPGVEYSVVDTFYKGQNISVRGKEGNWYRLFWVNAKKDDVEYYLDPLNFESDKKQKFQFLDLSKSSNAPASVLNSYLKGKGSLANQGQAFIDASNKYGVNDVYLISHAVLETGNGSSLLANGIKYKGVTVYNMYGVGAYDSCPIDCGAKKAYEEGWTTPYRAIVGGAKFIGNDYIKAGQNTIYKMRWNPLSLENGYASHQYATDIGWASKQITTMYNLYQRLEAYTLYLDIPLYN